MAAATQKKDADVPRFIMLSGGVNENSVKDVIKQIFEYNFTDPVKPITLVIDTYGGHVHSMFSLYNVMHGVTAPIHTVGLGKIMSAGTLLLAAGEKGHRKIGEHATLMIHGMTSFTYGTIFDQKADLEETERLQKLMIEAYVSETHLTKKKINKILAENSNKYYVAKDAVVMGFADEVLGRADGAE